MSVSEVLQVIALISFVLAAVGFHWKKTDLMAVGLAAWVLSLLIGELSSVTLPVILLILSLLAFVLAATGWGYKKVGIIAVGLALWVASGLIHLVVK